jgi:hypothetical protein
MFFVLLTSCTNLRSDSWRSIETFFLEPFGRSLVEAEAESVSEAVPKGQASTEHALI